MIPVGKIDKTIIRKRKLREDDGDAQFWASQTPIECLEAAFAIRQEYNHWKYGTDERFQRVLRIVKRK